MIDIYNCLNLGSPLVERGEGETLPGIVSIREYKLCNDVALLSNEPIVVAMPEQQWSYGLLLPLNHSALPPGDKDIVIQLVLSVRNGGAVGIAGLDAALTGLTTTEQVVGGGETTVTTTVANPKKTHAVVLRTASSGGLKPEVTLLDASAYRAGEPRRAPRRHDLGHDLFVVLSMDKTATQTVEQTLLSLYPAVQVRRTHFISPNGISLARKQAQSPSCPSGVRESYLRQAEYAENLTREIECVRSLGGRIAFVSGAREPIGRTIATLFQAIPEMIPGFALFQERSSKLTDLFSDYVTDQLWRVVRKDPGLLVQDQFNSFFEQELGPIAGIDVLGTPIDRDRGFTLAAGEGGTTLLYRFEDAGATLAPALAALVGRQRVDLVNANLSAEKNYADFYRTFRDSFKAPPDICSAIYDNDRYVRYFYSDAEIASFKGRWQAR
jgi:putative capsular polysaccharide synthesis protein